MLNGRNVPLLGYIYTSFNKLTKRYQNWIETVLWKLIFIRHHNSCREEWKYSCSRQLENGYDSNWKCVKDFRLPTPKLQTIFLRHNHCNDKSFFCFFMLREFVSAFYGLRSCLKYFLFVLYKNSTFQKVMFYWFHQGNSRRALLTKNLK